MSIVMANNDEDGFYIISDTKIIFNEDRFPTQVPIELKKNIELKIFLINLYTIWVPIELKKNIERYGMVKSIIIGGIVVLCFSGEDINNADKVVKRIRELLCLSEFSYEDIYYEVLNLYNSDDNLKEDGKHICDYILTFLINGRVFLKILLSVEMLKNAI